MPNRHPALRDGIQRWSTWFTTQLYASLVRFEGTGQDSVWVSRWRIHFHGGREVQLLIPLDLVSGDDYAFERTVLGMNSYDWVMLLRQEGPPAFHLNRNGMLIPVDGAIEVA